MYNLQPYPWWIYPVIIIDLILRGIALWRSARNGHKFWFAGLLIINSAGIVPLIYILFFEKKKKEEKKKTKIPSTLSMASKKK